MKRSLSRYYTLRFCIKQYNFHLLIYSQPPFVRHFTNWWHLSHFPWSTVFTPTFATWILWCYNFNGMIKWYDISCATLQFLQGGGMTDGKLLKLFILVIRYAEEETSCITTDRRVFYCGVWRCVCQWPAYCLHDYGRLVIANRLGNYRSLRGTRSSPSVVCPVSLIAKPHKGRQWHGIGAKRHRKKINK